MIKRSAIQSGEMESKRLRLHGEIARAHQIFGTEVALHTPFILHKILSSYLSDFWQTGAFGTTIAPPSRQSDNATQWHTLCLTSIGVRLFLKSLGSFAKLCKLCENGPSSSTDKPVGF